MVLPWRLGGFRMFVVVDLIGWLADEETQKEFGVAGECMDIGCGRLEMNKTITICI